MNKLTDLIFGAPAVHNPGKVMGPMNRKAKRAHFAKQQKIAAEPNRRKYEKRGVKRGRT